MTSKVLHNGSIGHHMQFARALCASLLLTAAFAAPAAAQRYPGDDVTVNTGAIGRDYLLYPGGRYGRAVRPLLQPGERRTAVIRLHMPVHRRVAKSVATKPVEVASAPTVLPPIKTLGTIHPRPVTSDPAALPEDSAARLVAGSSAPPPKPAKPVVTTMRSPAASPPPPNTGATMMPFTFGSAPVKPPPAPRTRIASATPPPAATVPSAAAAAGMKKQSTVLFPLGATSPAASDVGVIHGLAASLNAALSAGATRVQLNAYGGPPGDKSSDSRRLSLKRALVVRELLIEDGVPSEKIDVRAMGGIDDQGAADRVDVFVHA